MLTLKLSLQLQLTLTVNLTSQMLQLSFDHFHKHLKGLWENYSLLKIPNILLGYLNLT